MYVCMKRVLLKNTREFTQELNQLTNLNFEQCGSTFKRKQELIKHQRSVANISLTCQALKYIRQLTMAKTVISVGASLRQMLN